MINVLSVGNNIQEGILDYKTNRFEITKVTEALRVFNAIIKSPPDIIIIDMTDTKIDSLMIFERIRKIQASKTIPVLLITENEDDPQFRKLLQDDITKALRTPFSTEELCYKILRVLNIRANDRKKKVLIVDDDPVVLDTARMYLDAKYDVVTKLSADDCLEYVKENNPDLMILDVVMPEMDGIELLRKIKVQERLRRVPVLFQTGMCDSKTVKECMELNPQGYTVKPIVKKDLVSVVDSIFEKKKELIICYIDADPNNRAIFQKMVKLPYKAVTMEGSISSVNAIDVEVISCIVINYDNSMICLSPLKGKIAKKQVPIILASKNVANPSFQRELENYKTYGILMPIDANVLARKLVDLKLT